VSRDFPILACAVVGPAFGVDLSAFDARVSAVSLHPCSCYLLATDFSGFPAVATLTSVDKISPHNCVSTDSCVPVFDGVP
jgi:hypothetical protein